MKGDNRMLGGFKNMKTASRRNALSAKWSIMIAAILVCAIVGVLAPVEETSSMDGMQTDIQRFGIGLASLAEKECQNFTMGPAAFKVMEKLGAVSPEQRADLLERAEMDARGFLRAQGKELCDVAELMARPGALIERKTE